MTPQGALQYALETLRIRMEICAERPQDPNDTARWMKESVYGT